MKSTCTAVVTAVMSALTPCGHVGQEIVQKLIYADGGVRLLHRAPVSMVPFAWFVVVTKHASALNDVGQTVLVGPAVVGAQASPPNRSRV